jgi:hypothetical protein
MSVSTTVFAGLYSLPDDVLRALATFVPLSDLLLLVRCSRHFRTVLQSQLNRCLDRLFVVTHLDEHWAQAWRLSCYGIPYQPEQRVLVTLRGNSREYCFVEVDGQSILSLSLGLTVRKFPSTLISGKTQAVRDRFASWLRYRCEQQLATEAHGNTTEVLSGATSDL